MQIEWGFPYVLRQSVIAQSIPGGFTFYNKNPIMYVSVACAMGVGGGGYRFPHPPVVNRGEKSGDFGTQPGKN